MRNSGRKGSKDVYKESISLVLDTLNFRCLETAAGTSMVSVAYMLPYRRGICHENKYLIEILYLVEIYATSIKVVNDIIGSMLVLREPREK